MTLEIAVYLWVWRFTKGADISSFIRIACLRNDSAHNAVIYHTKQIRDCTNKVKTSNFIRVGFSNNFGRFSRHFFQLL